MQVEATGSSKAAVTRAIHTAAQATGASFNYLLATAKVESNLNPNLTVRTSTATGLFQFLEQTWLGTLKQAGPALGYGDYAAAITKSQSGRYEVADPAMHREIMQLRKDPTANAVMGGAFTQQNAAVLTQRIGRTPSEGELYIGHFFGPYAGAKAIKLAASQPYANAAEIFPVEAQSNRPIFYDNNGNARSIAGVCAELTRRYQVARASGTPASAQAAPARTVAPATIPSAVKTSAAIAQSNAIATPSAPSSVLAFASESPAPARSSVPTTPQAAGGDRTFRSLFQAGERREAVSPVVAALWSNAPANQPTSATAPTPAESVPLRGSTWDLFRDTNAAVRSAPDGRR